MSLLLSALVFGLVAQGPVVPPPDLVEREPTTGIKIVFERDGDVGIDTWGEEDYTIPVVKTITPYEIDRMRRIVRKAISKYPPGFLKSRLDQIYVCGALSVDGFEYGATYDKRILYLVDGGTGEGFDDNFLEQSFHHEFSSVLMYETDSHFPQAAWTACNPPSFSYKGYDEVWADKKSEVDWEEQRPQWLRMGMIKRYSLTSVEEDLNTIAESIFAGGPKFWRQADANPRLLKKARVAVGFYHRLDPWFTEKRFRAWAK